MTLYDRYTYTLCALIMTSMELLTEMHGALNQDKNQESYMKPNMQYFMYLILVQPCMDT